MTKSGKGLPPKATQPGTDAPGRAVSFGAHWRSLSERNGEEAYAQAAFREFPEGASEWPEGMSRRGFLKTASASLALAGLTGCVTRQPEEWIVPYVQSPERVVPGKPLFFATVMPLGGYGRGVLVESHEGRPTKIEGNPDHPDSLGAADAFAQASVLTLYDPNRSQTIVNVERIVTWDLFLAEIDEEIRQLHRTAGRGLRLLTGRVTSPTITAQIQRLLQMLPEAQWHQWEPVFSTPGAAENALYSFDRAAVVVSLGADFLGPGPAQVRHGRAFMQRRRVWNQSAEMSRLYVAETMPSMTGMTADYRLRVRPRELVRLAEALTRAVGGEVGDQDATASWIGKAAADLRAHRGSGVVVAGPYAPPEVHALARSLNEALGNVGQTVGYAAPVAASPEDPAASLGRLVADMNRGAVDRLVVLGSNPVYDAPADFNFREAMEKVRLRIHQGLYRDETARWCQWHLPESHYLESWGDLRATGGQVGLMQPLIAPLYDSTSPIELLSVLLGEPGKSGFSILQDYWRSRVAGDFDAFWYRSLRRGVVAEGDLRAPAEAGTSAPEAGVLPAANPVAVRPAAAVPQPDRAATEPSGSTGPQPLPFASEDGDLDLLFQPDASVWDGSFAGNAWLQELPRPVTTLTWDNAACMGPATALRLGLENEDVVALTFRGRSVEVPVLIVPGHAESSVTVHLGYGREHAGEVATGVGFSAYRFRPSEALWGGKGLTVSKLPGKRPLAVTEHQYNMHGRDLIVEGTLETFRRAPNFVQRRIDTPAPEESLYPEYEYNGYKWGMAIDLTTCIGCNACITACQAENNIPTVGKEQVMAGRAMHWIRVDRYYEGDPEEPRMVVQPVPCMHCEKAPCELVCPVAATVHDAEGLNVMVYNRCIGTRYCSNNCPYKVRRFNFLPYATIKDATLKMLQNPNVTVRTRGVMEKCTYCVQRISAARIAAETEDRRIRDGEVVPACAQTCPTNAILFGDLNDASSAATRAKASPLNYGLLAELNTRPRTTYLARVRNRETDGEG